MNLKLAVAFFFLVPNTVSAGESKKTKRLRRTAVGTPNKGQKRLLSEGPPNKSCFKQCVKNCAMSVNNRELKADKKVKETKKNEGSRNLTEDKENKGKSIGRNLKKDMENEGKSFRRNLGDDCAENCKDCV